MLDEKTLTKRIKTMFGAHHYVYISDDAADIAAITNLSTEEIEALMRSPYWRDALDYWGFRPELGDLKLAQQLWTELVENASDLFPHEVDYSHELPGDLVDENRPINYLPDTFVSKGLSRNQIREKIAEYSEFHGEPVKYDGFEIRGHHFWIYANYPDGIFSSAFARVNVAKNLVVDVDDTVYLVAIIDGQLQLTQTVSDDVVTADDKRLRVCL